MMRIIHMSEDQGMSALENNEFPPTITASAENVAVILTQGWCGQWLMMSRYLHRMEKKGEIEAALDVYVLQYDKIPRFQEFMAFKETVFNNAYVPYIRYYRHGNFIAESNYVGRSAFLSRCLPKEQK